MVQAKIRKMVTNHRNEFWDKKCLELQSYLGSKKSSDSWKFIKNIRSSNGKNTITKLLYRIVKKFQEKKKILEKCTGNVIEIVSNTVKHEIMRMKTGRAAGPGGFFPDCTRSRQQQAGLPC